jgi:hypothetical protein
VIEDEDRHHIATGHAMIRLGDQPDLADEPLLWAEIWSSARGELLPDWIRQHPGSRPEAFWKFDAIHIARLEGESEPACLHRHHLLSAEELEGIRRKARELVAHDRGRDPGEPGSNFIPPGDIHEFAARAGLLSAEERGVLRLDGRGEDLDGGGGPRGRCGWTGE